jgi:hypothetical protein
LRPPLPYASLSGGMSIPTPAGIKIRFAYVYIAEAHTTDEWPMPFGDKECRFVVLLGNFYFPFLCVLACVQFLFPIVIALVVVVACG